jgi:hypothetical protein
MVTNNITTRQVFRDEDLELTSEENTQVPESRMVAVEARTKSFIIDALATLIVVCSLFSRTFWKMEE